MCGVGVRVWVFLYMWVECIFEYGLVGWRLDKYALCLVCSYVKEGGVTWVSMMVVRILTFAHAFV